jgi:cell filamentation protein
VQYGHYTDAPEDNLLGLTSKEALNEQEALGVATVERYLLEEVNYSVEFSVALVQELHRRAFGHLYDWAGQWRRMVPNVDAYVPRPPPGYPSGCMSGPIKYAIANASCQLSLRPPKWPSS